MNRRLVCGITGLAFAVACGQSSGSDAGSGGSTGTTGASQESTSSGSSSGGTSSGSSSSTGGSGSGGSSGSSGAASTGTTGAGSTTGTSTSSGGSSGSGSTGAADAGVGLATFSYTPAWSGVTGVAVVGGFGQANDWKAPFLTLAGDGGVWSGSATLPNASYLYLFQVTGDAAASKPATYSRYVLDPDDSAYMVCPTGTPTVPTAASDPNPCSILTVPQGTPATLYHVSGSATVDGGPATGWLAVLERDEAKSHHFFVNYMPVDSSGGYDMPVAPGQYRMQIQVPTLESKTDLQRDPPTLNVQRRGLSAAFAVQSDHVVPGIDLAHGGYAALEPQDGGTFALPVTFSYVQLEGAANAHAAVYGAITKTDAGIQNIGDPWWTGKATTTATGTAWFDGGFNTAQALQAGVSPGERYLWGDWQTYPKDDAGFSWQTESLVFPIDFQ